MHNARNLEFSRIDNALIGAAWDLLDLCKTKKLTVVTAESCTGGLVAAVLTDAPGASKVVDGGFVTYSNEAKQACLNVPRELLEKFGAVSEQVARAMAEGALAASPADLSVSITGIAGPDGGTLDKPVGLVHFAAARRGGPVIHREKRFGDLGRGQVRRDAAMEAIALLTEIATVR
jgi:nicotinamide-nucleotide amidase